MLPHSRVQAARLGTVNKNNPNGEAKIKVHKKLFEGIWDNFVDLVDFCDNHRVVPISVVIEWPKGCMYWELPKVKKFLKEKGAISEASMVAILD